VKKSAPARTFLWAVIKSFLEVVWLGVVYEKNLGSRTLDEFKKLERFNPDKTWTVVTEREQ
jgi:hypothetical protein